VSVVRRIDFVVDCDECVGWGHFVRSHALAAELRADGCETVVHVNGVLPPFAGLDDAVVTGDALGSVGAIRNVDPSGAVVLDLASCEASTRDGIPNSVLLVVLQDGGELRFKCDLRIDPNVSGSADTTRGEALAGAEYVILRAGFDQPIDRSSPVDSPCLLISFGGTPRPAIVARALAALAPTDTRAFDRAVVVVPETVARSLDCRTVAGVSILTNVRDMPGLLAEVDAGLIAAGTLLHEACAVGLPCAVVALSLEQNFEAAAVSGEGAALYLGYAEDASDEDVRRALSQLADTELRLKLSMRARALVDGRGASRVASEILRRLAMRNPALSP
jgi:spore coat polysaccharide biosynthesis predicted glycosyltransferase SpsG